MLAPVIELRPRKALPEKIMNVESVCAFVSRHVFDRAVYAATAVLAIELLVVVLVVHQAAVWPAWAPSAWLRADPHRCLFVAASVATLVSVSFALILSPLARSKNRSMAEVAEPLTAIEVFAATYTAIACTTVGMLTVVNTIIAPISYRYRLVMFAVTSMLIVPLAVLTVKTAQMRTGQRLRQPQPWPHKTLLYVIIMAPATLITLIIFAVS